MFHKSHIGHGLNFFQSLDFCFCFKPWCWLIAYKQCSHIVSPSHSPGGWRLCGAGRKWCCLWTCWDDTRTEGVQGSRKGGRDEVFDQTFRTLHHHRCQSYCSVWCAGFSWELNNYRLLEAPGDGALWKGGWRWWWTPVLIGPHRISGHVQRSNLVLQPSWCSPSRTPSSRRAPSQWVQPPSSQIVCLTGKPLVSKWV